MTATARSDSQPKANAEVAVYCGVCRGWIGTVPSGTPWFRGRCINRRCAKYSEPQRIKIV
jgi:hypothetical protein